MQRSMTYKNQRFVTEYLKCHSITEAYNKAGYTGNAEKNAYRVFWLPEVQDAILSVENEARTKEVMNIIEAKKLLTNIANDTTARNSDRIKAIERLSKMEGWDAVEKKDITSGGLPIIPTEIVFYTTEESDDKQDINK